LDGKTGQVTFVAGLTPFLTTTSIVSWGERTRAAVKCQLTEENRKHPFSADRPITSAREDLLGRTGFAESLAAAIKGWKGNDSLVIALYGSWGSRKSANYVVNYPDGAGGMSL